MEKEKRLIDANALIAQFDDSFKGFVMARIIDEQPTVDAVEVVYGHWENIWYSDRFGNIVKCSICGYTKSDSSDHYCPHCGAEMVAYKLSSTADKLSVNGGDGNG